jgi:AcrR family transcriptional regulator
MSEEMPYRSTEKTRRKKDAKRTVLMQAAVRVFAEKGYYAATIRDIVNEADVAIGTFYFYFPDKETLFSYLYDETAELLLAAIRQAVNSRATLKQQLTAGIEVYIRLAIYEPAIVQLLLVGGVEAIPALTDRRAAFRTDLIRIWYQVLEQALNRGLITNQNINRTAQGLAGAFDEMILHLLEQPDPESEANAAAIDMIAFGLRAAAYTGS